MVKWLRVFWASSLRQNWPAYLTVAAVFALGLAAGACGVQKLKVEQAYELGLYLDRFLQQAGGIEVDTGRALRNIVYNDIMIFLFIYLLGLTIIGIPVMLGIIFTRGFVLGFTLAFLANEKSAEGIVLACAAVLPKNIFLVPTLLMGGVASLSFALLLARRFYNSKILIWPGFLVYSALMLVITACAAGAGLLDMYLTPVLVRLAANYLL
ncbi:MAG: stage II sporulation protein M [Peptococcaceae bacterium]|nr:stage II sporulation protein M [Peptococcaceae bacterium]